MRVLKSTSGTALARLTTHTHIHTQISHRGDEATKMISFKNALGLSDEDAAPVHVEVARRLFRQVRA